MPVASSTQLVGGGLNRAKTTIQCSNSHHVWHQSQPRSTLTSRAAYGVIASSVESSQDQDDFLETTLTPVNIDSGFASEGLIQAGGGGMLRLVAAWDTLSAVLPPNAAAGEAAELLLAALKLALTESTPESLTKALSLASYLAELSSSGLPIDAEAIAAGVLAEVGSGNRGNITSSIVEQRVSVGTARILRDLWRVRGLPMRVDLYDDIASAALREMCLAFYSAHATAVEVAARLHSLRQAIASGVPSYELQIAALEALQIFAPMGHALGMGSVAAQLEDLCFRLLFPASYKRTAQWLREETVANEDTLERSRELLKATAESDEEFCELASGLEVYGRTKTLFSTLKKLLRLGDLSKGGRSRTEIYDLLGLRAVVIPRDDLPAEEAEQRAQQACYLVEKLALDLWEPFQGRRKDYIGTPKANGYQSLHRTLIVPAATTENKHDDEKKTTTLELQIRTEAMHKQAEVGEAAHAAYKGGLDANQARQLRQWTDALLQRATTDSTAATSVEVSGAGVLDSQAEEGLFHHLDRNNDGYLSSEELELALAELGAGPGGAAAAAALELLSLADSNSDGAVSLNEFLEFQRRVGLLQATSVVDKATAAHLLPAAIDGDDDDDFQSPSYTREDLIASYTDSDVDETATTTATLVVDRSSPSFMSSSSSSRGGMTTTAISNSSQSTTSALHSWFRRNSQFRSQYSTRINTFVESSSGGSVSSLNSASSLDESEQQQSMSNSNGLSIRRPYGNGNSTGNIVSSSSSQQQTTKMTNPPPLPEDTTVLVEQEEDDSTSNGVELMQKPTRREWSSSSAVRSFMRLFGENQPSTEDAIWVLRPLPTNTHSLLDAAGQPLPAIPVPVTRYSINGSLLGSLDSDGDTPAAPPSPAIVIPSTGPCIIGGRRDGDCDAILDVPTVSGRHLRLEVVPWQRRNTWADSYGPTPPIASSSLNTRLMMIDLDSTNGTWVNRAKMVPMKEVPLSPGDVVHLATFDVAFEVQVLPPDYYKSMVNGVDVVNGNVDDILNEEQPLYEEAERSTSAINAALRIAAALEAGSASRGNFPPAHDATNRSASTLDTANDVRTLLAAERYQEAYMVALGGVLSCPDNGGLWAQLANLERQRARKQEAGSTPGTARAFYRAAIQCFNSTVTQQNNEFGTLVTDTARCYSSWALLEFDLGNDASARKLFRKAVDTALQHPVSTVAGGAPRLLFTWAKKEAKQTGDIVAAARLCNDALDIDPTNAYVLTLLGNIQLDAGDIQGARTLFRRALISDEGHLSALQSWARLEAAIPVAGSIRKARRLFRRALKVDPKNVFVLQAWAVAEANICNYEPARELLQQCLEIDPACRAALHAWAKLEVESGNPSQGRELYLEVLKLKPKSLETLSALGRLERKQGNLETAEQYLSLALKQDPEHAPALRELALVAESKGRKGEAYVMKKKTMRVNQDKRQLLATVKKNSLSVY